MKDTWRAVLSKPKPQTVPEAGWDLADRHWPYSPFPDDGHMPGECGGCLAPWEVSG